MNNVITRIFIGIMAEFKLRQGLDSAEALPPKTQSRSRDIYIHIPANVNHGEFLAVKKSHCAPGIDQIKLESDIILQMQLCTVST